MGSTTELMWHQLMVPHHSLTKKIFHCIDSAQKLKYIKVTMKNISLIYCAM